MEQKPFAVRYTGSDGECRMVAAYSAKEAAESFVFDTSRGEEGLYRVSVFDGGTMEMGDFDVRVVNHVTMVTATFIGATK